MKNGNSEHDFDSIAQLLRRQDAVLAREQKRSTFFLEARLLGM
jgi:hypothetical protein